MQESSVIQYFTEQAIERGIEKGVAQGETQAKQTALLKLIEHRFESVPEGVSVRIDGIRSVAQLDNLFEQALRADRFEELEWPPAQA